MSKKPNNPFPIGGYWGKGYFCDREKELETLNEHLANERNVVIYSWRRLGKTMLIKHFMAEMESKQKAEILYIDLLGSISMQQAIENIS